MRKLVAIWTALAAVWAPTAGAQAPVGDSVIGDLFDARSTAFEARIDAHSGPAGENPTGTASFHVGGGLGPVWEVEVTCLSVTGNTAVIGFSGTLFTFITLGEQRPVAGLIRVVDGGGPASSLDSFQWVDQEQGPINGDPIPGPTACSTYPIGQGSGPGVNQLGDIVVTDVLPFPTTKDQCQNGGWRTYGVFKNQGDCVSFVATGGKNARGNVPRPKGAS
jgi:hypothetical protein